MPMLISEEKLNIILFKDKSMMMCRGFSGGGGLPMQI